MDDITNADRARWALLSLEEFVRRTRVDDPNDAIGDLLTNLMHLARMGGIDPEDRAIKSLDMMGTELEEDEEGDARDVRRQLERLFDEPMPPRPDLTGEIVETFRDGLRALDEEFDGNDRAFRDYTVADRVRFKTRIASAQREIDRLSARRAFELS